VDLGGGWDRRSRVTLRFVDPELEREYQLAAAVSAAELRLGPLIAAVLWVVGGFLAPVVTGADPVPIYAIAAGMVIVNVVTALALASWATTLDRQQVIGVIQNLLAGIAVLAIAVVVSRFDQFAAPALMLISVFAFIVLRLQFTLASLVAVAYLVAFAAFGRLAGSTTLVLDLFLVGAAVLVGCGGTYLLEDAQRRLFAQRRLIASLHEQVNRLFHQYLSPDVAAALLRDPGRSELGRELAEISVLLADLQGFTPYSERTTPAAVVALLNEYFEAIVPIIFDEGGTIVQFAGDAVMAIFNAPVRQPDHALHAARAALGLQAAVGAIAGHDSGRPRFRAGVNTGPALVGNIGSQAIRNFTAIGDTTNLAARLQTFAEPGQAVIGERTYALIRSWARVRPLGTPQLKGKADPIVVYELLGLDADG
jgi:class 3 adenylate cyclase